MKRGRTYQCDVVAVAGKVQLVGEPLDFRIAYQERESMPQRGTRV